MKALAELHKLCKSALLNDLELDEDLREAVMQDFLLHEAVARGFCNEHPTWFTQTLYVEKNFSVLSALLWEKKPSLCRTMPPLARLLGLDQGASREAHYILAEVYASDPWKDLDKCLTHISRALAEVHPGTSASKIKKLDLKVLAALLWEQRPDLVARMPQLAQLLGLEHGTSTEAHYILAELYATGFSAFRDLDRSRIHSAAALADVVPNLTQKIGKLLLSKAFSTCREQLQALHHELVRATDAGLVATFLSELVDKVEAAPGSFNGLRQLQWLRDAPTNCRKLDQVAAMVWQGAPRAFAAKWPVAARRLKLDEGEAHAHLVLAELHSTETFRDLEKAISHCQQALASESSKAEPAAAMRTLVQLAQLARSEPSRHKWLQEAVLALAATDVEAQEELARLREEMQARRLHRRQAQAQSAASKEEVEPVADSW